MRTDVAIVGAGPAGGQAARYLAARGLQATLLDMRVRIGDPVQCGEAVSEVALRENALALGDWVRSRVDGVTAHVPDGNPGYLPAPGYCVDRGEFDRALVERSTSNGAQLLTNCHVRSVNPNGSVVRLQTSKGDIEAVFVIAADGPWSPTARSLGLVTRWHCNVGLQYKFRAEGVDIDSNWLHLFLAQRYGGGYAWIFPRGSEVSIGVDVPAQPRRQLAAFCRSLGVSLQDRHETNGGRIPTRVHLERLGIRNVLIAGDAAGATNPIFGGGIHAALSTGRMAAETILERWEDGREGVANRYQNRVRGSPFFHPALPAVADLLAKTTDDEFTLAAKVYRRRHRWRSLLQLLPEVLRRPRSMGSVVRLPLLRDALEVTARYGW
ncbi:MAG: NAD(P)/FAD-dependent oxidoreductase [Thermoplasmata archaeon]